MSNAANMLLSRAGNSYTNDLDGNTLTGGGRTNTWDSENRLVQCMHGADTSSFVYGADGIRRQSTVNGTTTDFVLDNSMFVRERNHSNGNSIATYFVTPAGVALNIPLSFSRIPPVMVWRSFRGGGGHYRPNLRVCRQFWQG